MILLNLPYVMANSKNPADAQHAAKTLDKTEIVSSTPHALESSIKPWIQPDPDNIDQGASLLGLLQRQISQESARGWQVTCISRIWQPLDGFEASSDLVAKMDLPTIDLTGLRTMQHLPVFPENNLSFFVGQELETLPPSSDVASSLIRDVLNDTIVTMSCNRIAAAKSLLEVDRYFSQGTFIKQGTQFDALRLVQEDSSTWKPEDAVVDAILSSMLQLPQPRCKAVYFHTLLVEICKVAPTAIAPSLGRAIRFFYNHVEKWDLEIIVRFTDWFAHHLSNFGFTWKWSEW